MAKRIFFLTDTHLGVRANSVEWIEIIEDYFYNFFIPYVEQNYQPGDVLIHCGDVFDSRNALNLRVLTSGIKIFERLSNIFKDGIHIIAGNHDVYMRNNNSINSLITLKWIPNIKIYEEPEVIRLGNASFLLMPWRVDHKAEKECIERLGPSSDYLVCHTDIQGFKFNKHTDIVEGCEVETFQTFKKVYSGHIHYAQNLKNISMLGSPFQLTRSDMGNKKGITILDIDSGKETYVENTRSPRFISMKFSDVLEMSPVNLNRIINNNFVDVYMDDNQINAPINVMLDHLNGYRRMDFHPIFAEVSDEDQTSADDDINFELMKFVIFYINSLSYNDDVKIKMINFITKLHQTVEQQEYQQA